VVLAFPEVPTYEHLGRRASAPLTAAEIEVWLVAKDGVITVLATP
jgi:hypothetical protein